MLPNIVIVPEFHNFITLNNNNDDNNKKKKNFLSLCFLPLVESQIYGCAGEPAVMSKFKGNVSL